MADSAKENPSTSDLTSKPAQSKKEWFVENILSLGFALLLVFMIRSSVVEAFKIPSGSMIPTLFVGDHIFVNKFAYGFKVPFSDLFLEKPINIIQRDPAKRGDTVVFIYPRDESFYYIKRVIGVPGDTIEVKSKVLFINGKEIKRDQVPAQEADRVLKRIDDPRYGMGSLDLYTEHLEGVDHYVLIDRNNLYSDNYGPITVPPENLFVMGDNRDFSNDSRFWGFVPFKNVKGKAMIIWLSIWLNFSESQYYFHPERIGTILH